MNELMRAYREGDWATMQQVLDRAEAQERKTFLRWLRAQGWRRRV